MLFSIDLKVLSAKPIELYFILSLQKPISKEQIPAQFDLKLYWHFLAKSKKALIASKLCFIGFGGDMVSFQKRIKIKLFTTLSCQFHWPHYCSPSHLH